MFTKTPEEWLSYQNRKLHPPPLDKQAEFSLLSKYLIDHCPKEKWQLNSNCPHLVSPFLLDMSKKKNFVHPPVRYKRNRWEFWIDPTVGIDLIKEEMKKEKYRKTPESEKDLQYYQEFFASENPDPETFIQNWIERKKLFIINEGPYFPFDEIIVPEIPPDDYKYVFPDPLSFEYLYQDCTEFDEGISVTSRGKGILEDLFHPNSEIEQLTVRQEEITELEELWREGKISEKNQIMDRLSSKSVTKVDLFPLLHSGDRFR